MYLADAEYNALINKLMSVATDLSDLNIGHNNLSGSIGEKFVGYCTTHVLWKLHYCMQFTYMPRSYFVIPHFNADRDGIHGIDYVFEITDDNENISRVYLEVNNWDHYAIPPDMFHTEILQRYLDADPNHEGHWIVTMYTRNIDDIQGRCEEYNIHILPITHHITMENLAQYNLIRNVISNFIDAFDELIRELVPERSYPDPRSMYNPDDRTGGVIQDIMMGVSYNVIENRYNVSRGYVKRLALYIRSFGIRLPDRRRND